LIPDAPELIFDVKPDGGLELMTRDSRGAEMSFLTGGSQATPTWLKLRRMGSTISAYVSGDGTNWRWEASIEMPVFGALTYVGLAVTSHDTSVTNTATFDHVALTRTWTSRDVGFTSTSDEPFGSAEYIVSGPNQFTVWGSGADIWGSSDDFHFVNAPMSGETGGSMLQQAEIIVRVASLQGLDEFAKAGVMFRESFDPGSPMVIFDVRPNGELEFMARTQKGGDVSFIAGGTFAAPVWLRLLRVDSSVQASYSSNGQGWATVGGVDMSFPSAIYGGLVVTSRDATSRAKATFDNLRAFSANP
jgi:regulation of enolase protein 1 (concanavalin A-like superfamily)